MSGLRDCQEGTELHDCLKSTATNEGSAVQVYWLCEPDGGQQSAYCAMPRTWIYERTGDAGAPGQLALLLH